MVQPSVLSQVNIPIRKLLEYIDVKPVILNFSAPRLNFTLDVVGHPFTHRLRMTQ